MFPDVLVRIAARGAYCSGTLLAPDTVLTCHHFFRDHAANATARAGNQIRTITAVEHIAGTDIAIVRIRPFEHLKNARFPSLASAIPRPGTPTVTFGFGGRARRIQARDGHLIIPLPIAISRTGSLVRPAGIVFNRRPARKGDSGGPVLADGKIVGIQSLIVDPFGWNTHLAMVNLLPQALVEELQAR
ncbi:serine protease [uncultured Corynebacterium sp.]|uniref:S1 family peptidase n=1 Tax=uncultured Corynebacterium sp. TaxID=159447 RepID=UPI0026029C5F|nr:serine protease [uncultured Corynebacterium sp.]